MVRLLKAGLKGLVAVGLAIALIGLGVGLDRSKLQPFQDFADRIEKKLYRVSGGDELADQVARVEATTVRLKGTVYRVPDNDYINGGALTQWDDDLIVLEHNGVLLRLDSERGLVKMAIVPPDNGVSVYAALNETEAYKDYVLKADQMRYNDILFIDTPAHHGLALSYTFFDPERFCYGTRVDWLPLPRDSRAATAGAGAEDWERLFETAPCLQLNTGRTALDGQIAGGRMAFKPPATLVLGSGEYHLDGVHTYDAGIQDDASDYGKVIGIDLDSGTAHHISKGHRNMQGVAVDKLGRIWVTEHGIRGGDELNLIKEGGNYGWPLETLGTLYSGQPWPSKGEVGRHILHTPPVFAWLPSAAISSLAVIDGFDPTWDGDMLAGSLSSAKFGHSLFHIRIRDERVLFVERIFLGFRIRYVMQYKDKIAVWTDHNELILFEVEKREDPLVDAFAAVKARYPEPLATKVSYLLHACNQCHSFEQGNSEAAPTLNGVVGRPLAKTGFSFYSSALKSAGGTWTPERLADFLDDPMGFAPGTSMPDPGLDKGELLDALIWTLQQIDNTDDGSLTYN